jgi:hypothetical protein
MSELPYRSALIVGAAKLYASVADWMSDSGQEAIDRSRPKSDMRRVRASSQPSFEVTSPPARETDGGWTRLRGSRLHPIKMKAGVSQQ